MHQHLNKRSGGRLLTPSMVAKNEEVAEFNPFDMGRAPDNVAPNRRPQPEAKRLWKAQQRRGGNNNRKSGRSPRSEGSGSGAERPNWRIKEDRVVRPAHQAKPSLKPSLPPPRKQEPVLRPLDSPRDEDMPSSDSESEADETLRLSTKAQSRLPSISQLAYHAGNVLALSAGYFILIWLYTRFLDAGPSPQRQINATGAKANATARFTRPKIDLWELPDEPTPPPTPSALDKMQQQVALWERSRGVYMRDR